LTVYNTQGIQINKWVTNSATFNIPLTNGFYYIEIAGNQGGDYNLTVAGIPSLAGDIDINGTIDLADAILALQILCELNIRGNTANLDADVNLDGKIGPEEAIHALQVISGVKSE